MEATLITHSKYKDQASVQEKHHDMTNEFTSKLTESLNESSQVISSFGYNVDTPKFNLDWTHGSVPTLNISFYVQKESVEVCRFNFKVECFWEHLVEVLKEKDENTKEFHEQVEKCNKNIEEHTNGPTGTVGIVEAISSLNELALKHPEAKEELNEAFDTIVNEQKEEVIADHKDESLSEDGIKDLVQENIRNMFNKVLQELKDKHQEMKQSEESSEEERSVEQEPLVLGDLDLVKIPKLEMSKPECTEGEKILLKNRFQQLVIDNKFQDVKVFEENIIECHWAEDNRIDAILKFNDEECFVGIAATRVNGLNVYTVVDDKTVDETGFTFEINDMPNCYMRVGTYELQLEMDN